jgi:quercetin dioxygenase-like cupin family protein
LLLPNPALLLPGELLTVAAPPPLYWIRPQLSAEALGGPRASSGIMFVRRASVFSLFQVQWNPYSIESPMISANLQALELQEEWSEHDASERLRSAFALHKRVGSEQSTVVYFELEPGGAVGTHTDSAEEVVLLLEGRVEVTLGDERGELTAGAIALVPSMVPHSVRNIGSQTARAVGFFSSARVISTFEHPLMPSGLREFDTDEL